MMTATSADVLDHPWQDKGLGAAPFRLVALIQIPSPELAAKNPGGFQNASMEACRSANALGVSVGTCDVCGTGIMNNFVIQSADRKRFVVGCDCVAKTNDVRLISRVAAAEKARKREVRQAKAAVAEAARKAEWEAARPAREEAERLRRERQELADLARREHLGAVNGELADLLSATGNRFAQEVSESLLNNQPASRLSDRCLDILRDICGKKVGRSGSKKYEAATEDFDAVLARCLDLGKASTGE